MSKSIHEGLAKIQRELKAPKGQTNNFGNYKYRSCEDILEALKPHLNGYTLVITDDISMVGERFYIKATATISDGKESISATGIARESLAKKGMDDSQITGSTSSYARKYALNGLFCIDDNKDADTTNTYGKDSAQAATSQSQSKPEYKKVDKPKDKADDVAKAKKTIHDLLKNHTPEQKKDMLKTATYWDKMDSWCDDINNLTIKGREPSVAQMRVWYKKLQELMLDESASEFISDSL
jgi:hypothetical protein